MIKNFTELLRVAVLSHLLIGASMASASVVTSDLILPNIKIGEIEVGEDQVEDLISDIHVTIFENGEHSCNGKNLVSVHGFTNTGSTWKPFAESLFADNPTGKKVCNLLAVDLPGRGGSTVPENTIFGYLTLENQVNALKGTLSRLAESGYKVKSIVAHSQGALLMQMLQQSLINEGSNLKKAFNVKRVILFAPSAPEPVPWFLADSGFGAQALEEYINYNTFQIEVPDDKWPYLFFVSVFGDPTTIVPNAPTPEEVTANGYNSFEPLIASLQLVGANSYSRPVVNAGVFSEDQKTELNVVSFAWDSLITPDEVRYLYQHLTGNYDEDEGDEHYTNVDTPDAIHSMYISNPSTILQAIAPTDVAIP